MRFFILIALTLMAQLVKASPVTAPSQTVVDQWFYAAQNSASNSFPQSGKSSCQSAIGGEISVVGYGDNQKSAQTRYLIQCLQQQCQLLAGKVAAATINIGKMSDQELTEYMYASGATQDSIARALEARKKIPASEAPQARCANATPLARMFIFDSCFAVPIRCQN